MLLGWLPPVPRQQALTGCSASSLGNPPCNPTHDVLGARPVLEPRTSPRDRTEPCKSLKSYLRRLAGGRARAARAGAGLCVCGFFVAVSPLKHLSREEMEMRGFAVLLPQEWSGQEFT